MFHLSVRSDVLPPSGKVRTWQDWLRGTVTSNEKAVLGSTVLVGPKGQRSQEGGAGTMGKMFLFFFVNAETQTKQEKTWETWAFVCVCVLVCVNLQHSLPSSDSAAPSSSSPLAPRTPSPRETKSWKRHNKQRRKEAPPPKGPDSDRRFQTFHIHPGEKRGRTAGVKAKKIHYKKKSNSNNSFRQQLSRGYDKIGWKIELEWDSVQPTSQK